MSPQPVKMRDKKPRPVAKELVGTEKAKKPSEEDEEDDLGSMSNYELGELKMHPVLYHS